MKYGEQTYVDLKHADCLEAMREGKHPNDAPTMARFLQAIVWRQDQLEAMLDKVITRLDDTHAALVPFKQQLDTIEHALTDINTVVQSKLRLSP